MSYCPAIIAPIVNTSRVNPLTYKFLNTAELIQPILDSGFNIRSMQQSNSRDKNSASHAIRLINHDLRVNDSNLEIVILNSHNGRSALKLYGGVYRSVCENGLLIGSDIMPRARILHSGRNDIDIVTSYVTSYIDATVKAVDTLEKWSHIEVPHSTQRQIITKIGEVLDDKRLMVDNTILTPRLNADKNDDLWSFFNRIQHNLLNGKFMYINGKEEVKNARKIRALDRQTNVNEAIYGVCNEFFHSTL
jgi:hypothetical protein